MVNAGVTDGVIKTDLAVDFTHTLGISSCHTNRAEKDVHLLEGKSLSLGLTAVISIFQAEQGLLRLTKKKKMKAAPIMIRIPNRMKVP